MVAAEITGRERLTALRALVRSRFPGVFDNLSCRGRQSGGTSPLLLAGWPELSAAWPGDGIVELMDGAGARRTWLAMRLVAAQGERGEPVAWLDPLDCFDPVSAALQGVRLPLLLWVRPQGIRAALTAAEVLLPFFSLVVLDLGWSNATSGEQQVRECRSLPPLSAWLRLQRSCRRSRAVLVVIAPGGAESMVRTAADLRIGAGPRAIPWPRRNQNEAGRIRVLA
ncbi:MAG: hypothetical protein HYV63_12335 [Candidatus Schekmanbacteria bacterium]|nr:hypothetical protein [Candidatus Schekmanbacteria bacterium]